MTHTFKLPTTGEITIEGTEEDLDMFFFLLRSCIDDSITFNRKYANCPEWALHLCDCYECLTDPSPYADPTLDLPF